MSPSIDNFRSASASSTNGNVFLNNQAPEGLTTTGGGFKGRVATWFHNLGSSQTTQTQANRATFDSFVQAIAQEKGQTYADLASALLHSARDTGQPLKGYMISSVLTTIDAEVGKVKEFNTEVLGRFMQRGAPDTHPNSPDAMFASAFRQKGVDFDPSKVLTQENIGKLKSELSSFIRQQAGPGGDKPVKMEDVRAHAETFLGQMADGIKDRLGQLDALEATPTERTKMKGDILGGTIPSSLKVAYHLSSFRANEYVTTQMASVLQGLVSHAGIPGRGSDYACGELCGSILKDLSDHKDAQTTGVSQRDIEVFCQAKAEEFIAKKSECFEALGTSGVPRNTLPLMQDAIIKTESLASPRQVQGLVNAMPAVQKLITALVHGSTPQTLLPALREMNQAFADEINQLPKECRSGFADGSFRQNAMRIALGSLLTQETAQELFTSLSNPQNLEMLSALNAVSTHPESSGHSLPLISPLDESFQTILGVTGQIAGLDPQDIAQAGEKPEVTQLPQGFEKLSEQLGLMVQGAHPNASFIAHEERMHSFSEETRELLAANSKLSPNQMCKLGAVLEHASIGQMAPIDQMAVHWMLRGETPAILALNPPTEAGIWQAVIKEPMPGDVTPENFAQKLYDRGIKMHGDAYIESNPQLKAVHNDSELRQMAFVAMGAALNTGVSLQKAIGNLRSDASLSLQDFQVDQRMNVSPDSYKPENAFGQTVDVGRWKTPTLMSFRHGNHQTTIDPNNHPAIAARTGTTVKTDDGVVTDILGTLRNVCNNQGEQIRTASAFLTQASTVMLRIAGEGLGVPFNEHGAFLFNVTSQPDGTVNVTVTADPSMPLRAQMSAVIHPDGSHTVVSMDVSKK